MTQSMCRSDFLYIQSRPDFSVLTVGYWRTSVLWQRDIILFLLIQAFQLRSWHLTCCLCLVWKTKIHIHFWASLCQTCSFLSCHPASTDACFHRQLIYFFWHMHSFLSVEQHAGPTHPKQIASAALLPSLSKTSWMHLVKRGRGMKRESCYLAYLFDYCQAAWRSSQKHGAWRRRKQSVHDNSQLDLALAVKLRNV